MGSAADMVFGVRKARRRKHARNEMITWVRRTGSEYIDFVAIPKLEIDQYTLPTITSEVYLTRALAFNTQLSKSSDSSISVMMSRKLAQ